MYRFALAFPALLILAFSTSSQQQKPDFTAAQKTPSYSTIPVEALRRRLTGSSRLRSPRLTPEVVDDRLPDGPQHER